MDGSESSSAAENPSAALSSLRVQLAAAAAKIERLQKELQVERGKQKQNFRGAQPAPSR